MGTSLYLIYHALLVAWQIVRIVRIAKRWTDQWEHRSITSPRFSLVNAKVERCQATHTAQLAYKLQSYLTLLQTSHLFTHNGDSSIADHLRITVFLSNISTSCSSPPRGKKGLEHSIEILARSVSFHPSCLQVNHLIYTSPLVLTRVTENLYTHITPFITN